MNRRGFRLGAQQSVLQTANGLELLAGKADPVSFFWQSRQQRPIEGWMGTDRCRQRLITCIGDFESHIQMGVFHRVGHRQSKREWKVQTSFRVVSQNQGAGS
ncbi:hypothetical protein GALL_467920 [mine drainage metagenome]|uniref:Uncharacterized protein n=1 Tax=mine drainage metagenome TaxID=410659 RepID=A0A1J5PVK6_9ZZZZ